MYSCDGGNYCRLRVERDIDEKILKNQMIVCMKKIFLIIQNRDYCVFYIPKYKSYIEFLDRNVLFYLNRKQEKLNIYNALYSYRSL